MSVKVRSAAAEKVRAAAFREAQFLRPAFIAIPHRSFTPSRSGMLFRQIGLPWRAFLRGHRRCPLLPSRGERKRSLKMRPGFLRGDVAAKKGGGLPARRQLERDLMAGPIAPANHLPTYGWFIAVEGSSRARTAQSPTEEDCRSHQRGTNAGCCLRSALSSPIS